MKYFISELIADGFKSQFSSIYVRCAVTITFLALLIVGPVFAQIPPLQKFALLKGEKNIGKETGNDKGDDKNLSVSLQDTTQHNVLSRSYKHEAEPVTNADVLMIIAERL